MLRAEMMYVKPIVAVGRPDVQFGFSDETRTTTFGMEIIERQ